MGIFNTTIRFDDHQDVDVEMSTVSMAGGWLINESWTLRGGVGLILDGDMITPDGVIHAVEPGGLFSVGLENRALIGEGYTPFVDLSLFFGASWTETIDPGTQAATSYFAADARFGARAGWNINNNTFPYVAARIFGGPVNWEIAEVEVTGSDIHHYQIALGMAVQLGPVGIFAEWAGVGEQAVSAGLSTSF